MGKREEGQWLGAIRTCGKVMPWARARAIVTKAFASDSTAAILTTIRASKKHEAAFLSFLWHVQAALRDELARAEMGEERWPVISEIYELYPWYDRAFEMATSSWLCPKGSLSALVLETNDPETKRRLSPGLAYDDPTLAFLLFAAETAHRELIGTKGNPDMLKPADESTMQLPNQEVTAKVAKQFLGLGQTSYYEYRKQLSNAGQPVNMANLARLQKERQDAKSRNLRRPKADSDPKAKS
jgi:hypothetical protein